MLLQKAQREKYYPSYITDKSAVNMLIVRVSDGYFYDFNDSAFKASGHTTKEQALTKALAGQHVWIWATGWTVPIGPRQTYQIVFQTSAGWSYNGPLIEVLPVIKGEAATGSLSTTEITTDLPSAVNDFYNTKVLQWITGAMVDQVTDISAYVGASKKLTVTAMTNTPANGDEFLLI